MLAIVNNAAMNIWCICLFDLVCWVSSDKYPVMAKTVSAFLGIRSSAQFFRSFIILFDPSVDLTRKVLLLPFLGT